MTTVVISKGTEIKRKKCWTKSLQIFFCISRNIRWWIWLGPVDSCVPQDCRRAIRSPPDTWWRHRHRAAISNTERPSKTRTVQRKNQKSLFSPCRIKLHCGFCHLQYHTYTSSSVAPFWDESPVPALNCWWDSSQGLANSAFRGLVWKSMWTES